MKAKYQLEYWPIPKSLYELETSRILANTFHVLSGKFMFSPLKI